MSALQKRPSREAIEQLERELMGHEQVQLATTHALAGPVYARTIFIPAGTLLTGLVHRADHVNISVGDITVLTDTGMRRLTGHHVIPTKAGAKRAGYAHADTHWTTVSYTTQTELGAIEDELVEDAERLQSRTEALPAPAQFVKLEA